MEPPNTGRAKLRYIYKDTNQRKPGKRKPNTPPLRNNTKRSCPDQNRNTLDLSTPKHTLESLPVEILSKIFEYVSSQDLTIIARLSRKLYWPAVKQIYKSLVFFDREKLSHANHTYKSTSVNHGTLVNERYITHVTQSIESNKSLGYFVQNITSHQSRNHERFERLFPNVPNLRSFHDLSGLCVPSNEAVKLASLSCSIDSIPNLTDHLTELRLISQYNPDEHAILRNLARDMMASGTYEHLKKLHFVCSAIVFYVEEESEADSDLEIQETPSWVAFIDEFAKHSVKLKVESLGLRGLLHSQEEVAIEVLQKGVDLAHLKTLVLNEEEETHCHPFHDTFLEALTKHTPRLESLVLYLTLDASGCVSNAISNTLKTIIPHQLKELFISFFPKVSEVSALPKIQNAIIESQSKLTKLTLEDGHVFDKLPFRNKSNDDVWGFIDQFHNDCNFQRVRRSYFPRKMDDFHSRPFMRPAHVKCIVNRKSQIRRFLDSDLIWKNVECFPRLQQYYINHIYVNVKRYGVYVNDETVLLDPTETE